METVRFDIAPCPAAEVSHLQKELGVSAVIAQILVRRGLTDPKVASDFLAGGSDHNPQEFSTMGQITERLLAHISESSQITVHGDYDVDGVCSTAVLVRAVRALGGKVDWYLPDRSTDGYGLNPDTVERLAARGTKLLITADCAITAVAEVRAAKERGLEVIVTDHHTPPADGSLPDALILHPVVCEYPCRDLCATGVTYKLAQGLWEAAGKDIEQLEEDLDLVALATIADIVPLRGENRNLVTRGLRRLQGTSKLGLQALMAVASVDPSRVSERAVGFALAPRLNAAGRLYRADAALELIMTEDPVRATQIADELHRANQERRHSETRILFEAEAQIAQQGDRAAYVLAGENWHSGVIGIVASRLAERHNRPVVVIALDEESGKGSGRSIDGFDLLEALHACGEHLLRYGGHRAAAGLEVDRSRLEQFRQAFTAHAEATLTPEDFLSTLRIDAVASGSDLGLDLAEELQALAPFGQGNPKVSLLLPAARFTDPHSMGEGKHLRFTVRSGSSRLRAVAFGMGGALPVDEDTPTDGVFALEVNEWNGVSEPRLNLRHAQPSDPEPIVLLGESEEYLQALWQELASTGGPGRRGDTGVLRGKRKVHDRRGSSIPGTLCGLLASGEPVLVLCADAPARHQQLSGRIGDFPLCSYLALEREPQIAADYMHVALLDPPTHPSEHRLALMGGSGQHAHLLWGDAQIRFAEKTLERNHDLRDALRHLYRELRKAGSASGVDLERLLAGRVGSDTRVPPRPVPVAADLLRILEELELIEIDTAAERVLVKPAERTKLELSATFRWHTERLADGRALLGSMQLQVA
ncbi:MAG TPA: single-stranded-DNA-specific exonuclease RecJ [Solirubrobacteraceae bacterium]|jgi:single-stranded-DNA-specific exonuclease